MSQFLARRWRQQPQGIVQIDVNNPIVQAIGVDTVWSGTNPTMRFSVRGGLQRNTVSAFDGMSARSGAYSNQASVGVTMTAANSPDIDLGAMPSMTELSVIAVLSQGATINALALATRNGSGSPGFDLVSGLNAVAGRATLRIVNSTLVGGDAQPTATFNDAFTHTYYGTWASGDTVRLYVDKSVNLATGPSISGTVTHPQNLKIANRGGTRWTGFASLLLVGTKQNISAGLELLENPWQIFVPLKFVSYSLPADLYTAIDEVISDRTDYIESSTAGQVYQTTLQPVAQPGANTNIDFNFEADSPDDAGSLKFELLSGQTVVKSQTVSLVRNWAGRLRLPQLRQQPQGAPQIDWSNPLTRGLVTVFLPINANHRDLISGATDTAQYRAPMGAGPRGLSLANTNGGNPWTTSIAISGVTGGFSALTTFCLYEPLDATTYGQIFGAGESSTYPQGFTKFSDGTISFGPSTNSGGLNITTSALSANRVYSLCGVARYNENFRELYVDGVSVGTNTANGTRLNSQFTFMGSVYQGGHNRCLRVYAFYCWTRELSAAEVRSVTENPWQIFRPPPAHAVSYVRQLDTTIAVTPSDYSVIDTPQVGRFLPQRWRQQPQGNVQVDWGNPLTASMSFAWTASAGYFDAVSGNAKNYNVNVDVIRSAASSRGIVQQTTTDGTVIWGIRGRAVNAVNNSFTIGAAFQIRNLAADNSSVFSVTTLGSAYNRIGFVASKVQASTTQANTTVNSDNTVAVGDWVYVVYVLQNGNFQLYVNGIKQTGTGSGTLPSVLPTPYNYVELAPSRVNLLTAFVATKPWTQTQVTEWTRNPWQIFRPATGRMYGLPPAGWPWTPTLRITSL